MTRFQIDVWFVCLITIMSIAGCASMERKQKRAAEMAELGLVSHPELADLQAAIARLDAKYDGLLDKANTLLARINTVEEAHREDTELVIDYVRRFAEEVKAEARKDRPR